VKIINKILGKVGLLLNRRILDNLVHIRKLKLYSLDKYKQDARILINYEEQIFSQNGEDGIVAEIFNRIGVTNKIFVELGVGDGLENNTVYLLLKNWSGYWIEGNKHYVRKIKKGFSRLINSKKMIVKNNFIKKETINHTLKEMGVPDKFDLLSIDIDGNDYWILESMRPFKPRLIIVEYNASLGKEIIYLPDYDPNYVWDKSNFMGASLAKINDLLEKRGYKLVACNLTGANAFFVRGDLIENKFFKPGDIDFHFEAPKYDELLNRIGHKKRSYKIFNNYSYHI
jgi:hypothetical protein